jgi:hypothetical protein
MSFDKQFTRPSVNLDALSETLRVEFGAAITGVSSADGEDGVVLIIHFTQPPTEKQSQQAQAIIEAHDPAVKSQRQQAEEALKQQRQEKIANPIDPTSFGATNQPIRQLADRVAWLEAEVKRLVGA